MEKTLQEDEVYNFSHPLVVEFFEKHISGDTKREQAVSLYYAVRDEIRYNPYFIRLDKADLHVNSVLSRSEGHCIDKANAFIALCRRVGIPARLGLAKVRNHLGTSGFERILRSNVLAPHGYAEIKLDGEWIKCTPAFNKELCQKLGVQPLDFDGVHHALFQAFDRDGGGYMEYLEYYGSFDEFPMELVTEILQKEYPHLFDKQGHLLPILKS